MPMDIEYDPAGGESRKRMMESYRDDVLRHLKEARFAASIIFREDQKHNVEWLYVVQDINRILERARPYPPKEVPKCR
jgi:hypothetical protein